MDTYFGRFKIGFCIGFFGFALVILSLCTLMWEPLYSLLAARLTVFMGLFGGFMMNLSNILDKFDK